MSIQHLLEKQIVEFEKKFCGSKTYSYFAKKPDEISAFLSTIQEELVQEFKKKVEFERSSFWSPTDGGILDSFSKGNNEVVDNLLSWLEGETK